MALFVIDASATPCTEGLLSRCAAGEEVMVESVWPLEITNVLLYAQRQGRVTAERVEQFLTQLLRFRIAVEPFTTQQAVRDVRRLAQTYQLTAYDAAYLELALHYTLSLATLDRELIAAARAAGVRLIE